eukprot:gene16017-22155_t
MEAKVKAAGYGPAGSTAAMYLADQGFTVDVYERRPEPRGDGVDTGRAYIIILIPRGQASLEQLGIKIPKEPEFLTKGTVRIDKKGKKTVVKEEGNVTFSRSDLAQFLIDTAKARHPGKIEFHFEADVEAVDFEKNEIAFQQGSSKVSASYDLLVGADGAGSKVRDSLASYIPGYEVEINSTGRDYKVYADIPGNVEPPELRDRKGTSLHLWSNTGGDPFSSFTAHSNPDGTYTGTFSLAAGKFDELKTEEDYMDILKNKFVGIPEDWIKKIPSQLVKTKATPAGKRVKCSQLYGPSTILIGDAAHAVSPVFGQGANSSLEDSPVLSKVLQAAAGDMSQIPEAYDLARKEDAHALFEIDRKAFSLFRRQGLIDLNLVQLLSHVVVGTILSKLVPFLYGKDVALLKLGSLPYGSILRAVQRDSAGAAAFFLALAAFGIAKLAGY